jgi:hypothetical protein
MPRMRQVVIKRVPNLSVSPTGADASVLRLLFCGPEGVCQLIRNFQYDHRRRGGSPPQAIAIPFQEPQPALVGIVKTD